MEKFKLGNGITILFEKNSSKSVAVEVMFKFGSNFESKPMAGIAHFLEHMLFEGTKNRQNSREIANEIEKFGGEFNAYTTGDRTAFFIKIISKRIGVALDILSDMVANPLFEKKIIEKEKKVVLKEINMVNDDLRSYQWILFQKSLFERHPAKNPTYGSVETVSKFDATHVSHYYRTHYLPNNMIVSVVGNASNVKEKIKKYFGKLGPGNLVKRPEVYEPPQTKIKKFVEKRKTFNSYMVLGYKTVSRIHKDSYVFDVITAILGRGQSGRMFDEIRNKRGLAYQVGINNEQESDCGMFAVYTGLDKTNIEKAKEIILKEFRKLKNIKKSDLEEAKTYVEGNYTLQNEENFHRSDNLAFWECIKDAKLSESYLKNVRKVTIQDVKRVARKYLTNKYTLVVIEQK